MLKILKNLGAYVYTNAHSGSVYIKFKDSRLGSLRIGDHDGIGRYRYRWNLRSDINDSYVEEDRGIKRFYYSFKDIEKFAYIINQYYMRIRVNESKRSN